MNPLPHDGLLPRQDGCEAVPWGERCRALLQKIQRRRQALAPRPQTPPPSEDSREEEQQSHQEDNKQEEESASPQPSKDLLQRLEEEVRGILVFVGVEAVLWQQLMTRSDGF